MAIFDSLIKPALDSVTALISQFHLSPEEKAQAERAIRDAAAKAQQSAFDYDVQLNRIASDNIRADASTGDKYTQRARPTFLYFVMLLLAVDYVVLPIAQIFGSKVAPFALPPDLLTLFGVGIGGYVMSRSVDKALSLPGDSQVNLLGVLKASNKS